MTGNQAPPHRPGRPAAPAATARPDSPAGHHPAGRRSAGSPAGGEKDRPVRPAAGRRSRRSGTGDGRRTGHGQHHRRPDTPSTASISAILDKGDIVTGVRGTTDGNVILTGSQTTSQSPDTFPFLYQGPLTSPTDDQNLFVLHPPFHGETTATFYGPNTSSFNPGAIPADQVRAVGSYQSSASRPGTPSMSRAARCANTAAATRSPPTPCTRTT